MWGTSSLFTWDPYFHREEEALTQQANLQVFFLAGWFSTWFFLSYLHWSFKVHL